MSGAAPFPALGGHRDQGSALKKKGGSASGLGNTSARLVRNLSWDSLIGLKKD